jgi:saccharopine dehydrogenase-like NADP-dependent oxidoreductase
MGRFAVRTAAAFDAVAELIVADRNEEAAQRIAALSGAKARGAGVDVTDPRALGALLRDADVVLNTVGPFYRFGASVLEAAIEAGCHYLDICDDWEPTLALLELDGRAREAGVSAVVGLGASPGVSNLLAAKAMARLEEVREVVTGWSLEGAAADAGAFSEPGRPSAALVHWVHQCSGTIRVRRGGDFADVRPIQEVELAYPGRGRGCAWTVGHPEPLTLPRYHPEIRESVNVMVGPRAMVDALRGVCGEVDAGRLRVEEAAALLSGPIPPQLRDGAGTEVRLPPLFALARGLRAGEPVDVGAAVLGAPSGGMGGATGVPLAVGLSLLARGAISKRGVFAPEGAIDADAFFDALAPHCDPPLDTGESLVRVSEAPAARP